jgi:hypothetical protein
VSRQKALTFQTRDIADSGGLPHQTAYPSSKDFGWVDFLVQLLFTEVVVTLFIQTYLETAFLIGTSQFRHIAKLLCLIILLLCQVFRQRWYSLDSTPASVKAVCYYIRIKQQIESN